MNLTKFPRRKYTEGETPINYLSNLSSFLKGPDIYMKRDDLLGLTSGGNKTRKLEFLVADALNQGADTLITCGSVQSNHCRLTLAAAAKEGLNCRLVLEERVPNSFNPNENGNNFLFNLLGVEDITVVPGGYDLISEMQKIANQLQNEGRKPYIIPVGGSNEIGSLGYVAGAQELQQQLFREETDVDYIVCPSGSGGTHSGLVTGFTENHHDISVLGINIRKVSKEDQEAWILNHAQETLDYIGGKKRIPSSDIRCFDDYVGPGYSLPTPEMIDSIKLVARSESILLDPVYTGKAMAGLIDLIHRDFFSKDDKVMFLHTGGVPALYAHTSLF